MNALERSIMTMDCRDCDGIPKVANAGRIFDTPAGQVQVMHNGIKVKAGGYHGDWMAHIIRALKGHHEPQEERLFETIVQCARHHSLFVELGSFWAYYTMWYLAEVPGSQAICIEPDPNSLEIGRFNANLNHLEQRIEFHQACVGADAAAEVSLYCESDRQTRMMPSFDMASVLALAGSRTIEVLHMDVQGAELPFIRSMPEDRLGGKVRFLVVSTHHHTISGSHTTHEDCIAHVKQLGGHVLCEHSVQQSFSGDGLIVASFFPEDARIVLPPISRNSPHLSLFPDA